MRVALAFVVLLLLELAGQAVAERGTSAGGTAACGNDAAAGFVRENCDDQPRPVAF